MKHTLIENRKLASVILALAIAGSILLTGGGGLKSRRGAVEQTFYGDMSIQYDLNARAEAAYNILSVARRYAVIDDQLVGAADDARQALTDAQAIAGKAAANTALARAIEDLYNEVVNADLTEKDESFAKGQYAEFKSRSMTIGHNAFNQNAEAYNRDLGNFPASFIGRLCGIVPIDLFV